MAEQNFDYMAGADTCQISAPRYRCGYSQSYFAQLNKSAAEKDQLIRHQIMLLEAKNNEETYDLRLLAHSCTLCDNRLPFIDSKAGYSSLQDALIHDTKTKLREMEHMAQNINTRVLEIQNLKKLSEFYRCGGRNSTGINRAVQPTVDDDTSEDPSDDAPDNAFDESFDDDIIHDYSLDDYSESDEVYEPQPVLKPSVNIRISVPNLLDVDIPPLSTPVLKPVQVGTPPAPSPKTAAMSIRLKSGLEIPPVKIWDSIDEESKVLRAHRGSRPHHKKGEMPLIFDWGIQYNPKLPRWGEMMGKKTERYPCRMVVFLGLDPATTIQDILDKVCGGMVLSAAKAGPTSAYVNFFRGEEAYAYVDHVNRPGSRFHLLGIVPRISLAGSPSYPLREVFRQTILYYGETRVLGFRDVDEELLRFLLDPRYHWQIERWYADPALVEKIGDIQAELLAKRIKLDDDDCAAEEDAASDNLAPSEFASTEPSSDEHSSPESASSKPLSEDSSPKNTRDTIFYYRAISYASHIKISLLGRQPRPGLYFAQDPCARPLDELE